MVDVDIDVQHTLMVLEQLQNGQHDVVYIAKAGRFRFLRVVQSASPVQSNVACLLVQLDSAGNRTTGAQLAELEQTVEHRTVLTDIDCMTEKEKKKSSQNSARTVRQFNTEIAITNSCALKLAAHSADERARKQAAAAV